MYHSGEGGNVKEQLRKQDQMCVCLQRMDGGDEEPGLNHDILGSTKLLVGSQIIFLQLQKHHFLIRSYVLELHCLPPSATEAPEKSHLQLETS